MPQPSSQDQLNTPATLFSYTRTATATLVLRFTVFNDTKWPASIEMVIPLLYLLDHTTQKARLCGHQTYSYTDKSNSQKQLSDTQTWWHRRPPCPEWESSRFHARKVNARTHIVIVQPSCTSIAVLDYLPAVRPWVGWRGNTAHQPPSLPQVRIQRNFLGQTAASRCEGFPTYRELAPSPSLGCAGGLVLPSHLEAAVCPRNFQWIWSQRKLQDLLTSLPIRFKYIHSEWIYKCIRNGRNVFLKRCNAVPTSA
jgi:hypothetical protein